MKQTKNQRLRDKIYGKIAKKEEIYYPKDIKRMILLTIKEIKQEEKQK